MKESARYVKIVEWSDVEETIELYKKDGKPLPPPTSGKDYANKMLTIA
jgi:hypothetical protein